jgi:DNA-binding NarL/FixJ family response regulator
MATKRVKQAVIGFIGSGESMHRTLPPDIGALAHGRVCCERRIWADAYCALAAADETAALGAADLELLAMSAYLIGREDDYLRALERAYWSRLGADERLPAIRCAAWLSSQHMFRGAMGRATGWLGRAQRLLTPEDADCAERGHVLLAVVDQHFAGGDFEAACADATSAAAIGERCGDAELIAMARCCEGRALVLGGQIAGGLALLDEAMMAVTTHEMSPIAAGLIYCSLIDACGEAYALSRAREWTHALREWCARHQQLVAFTGVCHVHHAEILQLGGAWSDCIEEARRARSRCLEAGNRRAAAAALYQQAEVHRLRGEHAAAEDAYREAGAAGGQAQPGLALLRLAQGNMQMAGAAIRSALSGAADGVQRTRLLAACVDIMLAAGDIAAAEDACRELEQTAHDLDGETLPAIAAQARGSVALARGDAQGALGPLRRALDLWRRIGAPYAEARVRAAMAEACRILGDEDGAEIESGAARAAFARLGAQPDIARIDAAGREADPPHSLTARELQVLRLVATGRTNKAIAAELSLSERTIDRHVSSIFSKLHVPSRTAAAAFAYERKLI